ncbi:MAG: alpha-xylosidase [Armatimonadetes bacterium]|nr:alpha-xylosidase [Armatimonadota bacterium]
MKFCDGGWRLGEGVAALFPKQVYEYFIEDGALVVYAVHQSPPEVYDGRLITIKLSSPLEGVVRVQATHYAGGKDPMTFPIEPNLPKVTPKIEENDELLTFTSGNLSVQIQKKPWKMQFMADGKVITSSPRSSLGYMTIDKTPYMMERLNLNIGECIYGMGERFGPVVKNGQSVEIYNTDSSTWSDLAYKNVPFYMSNKGYGLLVNSPAKVEFEVATERCEQMQFSVPGEVLDYYFFHGPSHKEVFDKYTALTGRPALPPAWSFGLWLTTSFTTQYDEKVVTSFIDGMLDRDIPLKVFHYDCSWMKDNHWCDFTWDKSEFPDPAGMLKRIKEKGVKICLWINPYIAQPSSMFKEGKKNGYFLKRQNGSVYQEDWWQPGMAYVDFTNPAAVKWYQAKLRALLDMGCDTFKTDFGEMIPDDAVYFDSSDPKEMHNFYTYLYNQCVFELLEEYYGKGQACLFARSATAGCQKFPVHWGGDCVARFESMAEELRGGLSFAMSGFSFWSHDIGGFIETATPTLYKRWFAWGLFCSHSRLHGSDSYRVPWLFDEESVDVVRFFTKTKNKLMPYIFAKAVESHQHGWPMLRPMVVEFPEDRTCDHLETQYMLGDALLVSPVLNEEGTTEYYLPQGAWTHFFSGVVYEGGKWYRGSEGFMSIPVFVRENTVLPIGALDSKTDYAYADSVTLNLYNITDGANITTVIPNLDGSPAATFTTKRKGSKITIDLKGEANGWSAVVKDTTGDRSYKVDAGAKTLSIEL